jgi:type I restriction enzyme, S subunit
MTNTTHDPSTDELPDGWTVDRLDAVVEVLDSRRKPVNAKERAERPGAVPYFGATGQVGTIDEALFDEPLVLLGEDGVQFFDPNKSKAYEIDGPAWVNNHAHVLRPDEGKIPRTLLVHYLNQFDYRGSANGTTRLKLTQKAMNAIPVVLPPLAEQERIVEVLEAQLSRLGAALEHVQTLREKAAQFRRSLLHAAFTGALTGHDTSTGELPEGWETKTLGDLVSDKADIVDGPFGSNLKSAHYTDSGARVIRLQNIGFGEFREADAFISLDHYATLEKHNVSQGDLLFSSLGENLPRACLTPDLGGPAIVKADCIRVRLSDSVNSRFVLHSTQRPEAKSWANEQMHGMGRPRLGLGKIRGFPVPFPPMGFP